MATQTLATLFHANIGQVDEKILVGQLESVFSAVNWILVLEAVALTPRP